jgi:drug/metabolite transporter (DMT)-like permease
VKIGFIEILLFVVLSIIWGSSFFFMKHGMYDPEGNVVFTNQQVASLRMVIAGTALLPVAIYNIKKLAQFKVLKSIATVGIFGNFFPAFLFTFAQTGLISGYVGMLNSATPIFSVLIAYFIFKDKLEKRQILGLFLGNIGVILLMSGYVGDAQFNGGLMHVFAVVLATLFYGISLNTIKFKLKGVKAIHITSLAFLVISVPGWFCFFWFDTLAVFHNNPLAYTNILYILALSLLGTVLGVYLYALLIARSTTLFSSMVTFAMPIVSVFIGLLDGESFTGFQLISLLVICAGIIFANRKRTKVKDLAH